MKRVMLVVVCLVVTSCAAGQGDDRALKSDLVALGLAYHSYQDVGRDKAPASVEDLQKLFKPDTTAVARIKSGDVIVRWGLNIPRDFPGGSSNTVLAYEKNVPVKGGMVLMADASLRRMSAAEFAASPSPETEADRAKARDVLKAEVEKIDAGRSERREAKVGDRTLKVGDTAEVSGHQGITVMSMAPGSRDADRRPFGDDASINEPGTVRIVGFADDGKRALVEYVLPKGVGSGGASAPAGARFFLTVEEFARWSAENAAKNAAKREERVRLKDEVRRITEGKSVVTEVRLADRTLKVGDTARIGQGDWVQAMNLTPVKSQNDSFVVADRDDFDTCRVETGGTITILGFSDDRAKVLVEYTLPAGESAAGTLAPSGVRYFIAVGEFGQVKK